MAINKNESKKINKSWNFFKLLSFCNEMNVEKYIYWLQILQSYLLLGFVSNFFKCVNCQQKQAKYISRLDW
jgi:hypothetical protein